MSSTLSLTPEGQRVVNDVAQRHGFSPDAVAHMLQAVRNGNGSMAQFSHPEFGGFGQWMAGGMTMVGDMFNNALKGRVDSLCQALAAVLNSSSASVWQTASPSTDGGSGLFRPDPASASFNWWPAELGSPNASGSQNNVRYAYFGPARRLAVQTGGEVWVYDTLDHQIGGFSQQQGMGSAIVFSSQYGSVNLASLPVVARH